mgnify:FL=1
MSQAVGMVGMKDIIDQMKRTLQSEIELSEQPAEFQKILDNFDELLKASIPLIQRYGIEIEAKTVRDNNKDNAKTDIHEKAKPEETSETESDKQLEEDEDADDGDVASVTEYLTRSRELSPETSLSKKAISILSNIAVTVNGEVMTDDLGLTQYYDPIDLFRLMEDICAEEVLESSDFAFKDENDEWQFPAFDLYEKTYPWIKDVKDLIRKNEPKKLIPQLYVALRNQYVNYHQWVITETGKNEHVMSIEPQNQKPYVEAALVRVRQQFFQGNKISKQGKERDSVYDTEGVFDKALMMY